jgi:hypoxanthine phosphoribosyltransferase
MIPSEFSHITWEEVENSCLSMFARMCRDNYRPNIIIGILKGGAIPASLFVDYFGHPISFLTLRAKSRIGLDKKTETILCSRTNDQTKL